MTPPGAAGHGRRAAAKRGLLVLGTAAAVVAADQATKSWAEHALAAGGRHVVGPVYLELTLNSGAAFSLGAGATPVIETVALVLVALVLWQSGRLARRGGGWLTMVGLGLLAGGALSNLADRLVRDHHGAVVDFIQLVSWWPVFNLADAAVTVGALMLVAALAWPGSRNRRPTTPEPVSVADGHKEAGAGQNTAGPPVAGPPVAGPPVTGPRA